jgi:hypothetical protein
LAGIKKYPKGVRMFSHMNEVVAALNDAPVGSSAL